MDNTCTICFEDMDMKAYGDERDSTPTCFKLECNHAFHTKCIVECLQKTRHKCPSCNENKSLEETLSREGVILEIVDEIKKVESVKLAIQEFRTAKHEITESIKFFKEDVKKYAEHRKTELKILEKYKYYIQCQQTVSSEAKKIAKSKGGKYRALFDLPNKHMRYQAFERGLFGSYVRYYNYQYKHPHFRITI